MACSVDIPLVRAVVVSFNPQSSLIENIQALASQVDGIFLVDNASDNAESKNILTKIENAGICHLIYNKENYGIAHALNRGVMQAAADGVAWVLTFDQDSLAPPNFVESLFRTLEGCSFRNEVALVAPRYRDEKTGLLTNFGSKGRGDFAEVDAIITSGNLLRVKAFESVVGYDESYFIDCVDHDFCLKLRKKGWRVLISSSTELLHSIGVTEVHKFLGKEFKISTHSPLRRYYNARNRILTYRRHALSFPRWAIHDVFCWLREMGAITLLEDEKLKKLKSVVRGVLHALLGRSGKAQ